jgi:hypothetical protein
MPTESEPGTTGPAVPAAPSSAEPAGVGALTRCPVCAGALAAVSDGDTTNFLCRRCGRCWHVELGRVSRVDPASCPGCPHEAECRARAGRA